MKIFIMKKSKFKLKHIVLEDTKEVLVVCTSAITAMGVSAMVKQYYPGYTSRIISESYYDKMTVH